MSRMAHEESVKKENKEGKKEDEEDTYKYFFEIEFDDFTTEGYDQTFDLDQFVSK